MPTPDQCLQNLLTAIVYPIALQTQWLLFTNVIEIEESTTLSNLTEAIWPGYVRCNNGSNSAIAIDDEIASSFPITNPTFTNSDSVPHSYAGVALVDAATGSLWHVETLPVTPVPPGSSVVVLPTYTLQEILPG